MTPPLNIDIQGDMEDDFHCTHPPSNELSNEASPIEGNEGIENSQSVLINKLREKCGDNITIARI